MSSKLHLQAPVNNPYSESTNAPDKGTNLKNVTETIDRIKDHLEVS